MSAFISQGRAAGATGPVAFTAEALAERIGARVVGDGARPISGLGALPSASPDQLSHLSSAAFRRHLGATRAGAVLLRESDVAACPSTSLVVDDPYAAYATLSHVFARCDPSPVGADPTARIGAAAAIDPSASIGPFVVVADRTRVGARVRIGAHCVIGSDVVLDDDVVLHPSVTLYADVRIGARSVVHSGAVIGADGFGYARARSGVNVKIAQLGGVRIGADVEIGACTTIDRGAIDDTVIGDGVKIDNQVQIGHNCVIGAHTVICGCVGIVGSTRVGAHCVLAGGVGIGGDRPIELADGVVASGMTHVSRSVDRAGIVSGGTLFQPTREWKRNVLRLQQLDALARRVAALEKRRDGS